MVQMDLEQVARERNAIKRPEQVNNQKSYDKINAE